MENETRKQEFVNWIEEEGFGGLTTNNIVVTTEPAENFVKACIAYRRVDKEQFGDKDVTIILDSQRYKGERRCDLFILDDGEVRYVAKL